MIVPASKSKGKKNYLYKLEDLVLPISSPASHGAPQIKDSRDIDPNLLENYNKKEKILEKIRLKNE